MDYKIQETVQIMTPSLEKSAIAERDTTKIKSGQKRLIAEVAAIHEGVTANYNKYTAEELLKATESWLLPYPKPILRNHDMNEEPLGRIVDASYVPGVESGFIKLRAAILDPEAINKVLDGRYLTGSVGGMPGAAICSICYTDVVRASREGMGCGHRRGSIYEEKTCVYEHRDIKFYEYSFVNAPGDSESSVLGTSKESAQLSLYMLDLAESSVASLTADAGFVDLREQMGEKEAESVFLEMAFGHQSALALEAETRQNSLNINSVKTSRTIKEETTTFEQDQSKMAEENQLDDEDILGVTDSLKEQLQSESPSEDEVVEEASSEETTEVTEEAEAPEVEVAEEEETTVEEEEVTEPEVVSEAEEAADEVAAEESEETEAEVTAEEQGDETPEVAEETEAAAEEEVAEEAVAEAEVATLTSRIEELEAENGRLKEQVASMKQAIHEELAYRVVEARIAVGFIDEDEREAALEEHKSRSASSLADALVDIRKYAESHDFVTNVTSGVVPGLQIKSQAVAQENAPIEGEDEVVEDVIEESERSFDKAYVEELSELLSVGVEKYRNRK